MRERFEEYFKKTYPGMALDGPTAKDEFRLWEIAFVEGSSYQAKYAEDCKISRDILLGVICGLIIICVVAFR